MSVANAVPVKPNRVGTITRAERVLQVAQAAGYGTVASARSGDTEDSWVADLAVGCRAGRSEWAPRRAPTDGEMEPPAGDRGYRGIKAQYVRRDALTCRRGPAGAGAGCA